MPIKPMLHSILQLFEPYMPQSLYNVCKNALGNRVVINLADLLRWEGDAPPVGPVFDGILVGAPPVGPLHAGILPLYAMPVVDPVVLAGDQDMDLGDRESLEP